MKILLLFFMIFHITNCEYDKETYKLYKVIANNSRQRDILFRLSVLNDSLIFLNGISNQAAIPINLIIGSRCEKDIIRILDENYIQYFFIETTSTAKLEPQIVNNRSFYTWNKFKNWVDKVTQRYLNINAQNIGFTYENREIILIKLCKEKTKPAVFIISGEDGKDWLSPSVIIMTIDELLRKQNAYKALLDNLCFHFLPVLNPDGYEYSMSKDRFWSKNRESWDSIKYCPNNRIAVGTNIDHNWYFSKSAYIFNGKCNSIHYGYTSVSLMETKAVAHYLSPIANNFLAYINVKGFSRIITLPYATQHDESPNHNIVIQLIEAACKKIYNQFNSTYYYGITNNLFYNASGNSADWVKKNLNLPIVFTAHLQYKESVLPQPTDIQPISNVFMKLLSETLLISNEMYGVLYSHQETVSVKLHSLVPSCCIYLLHWFSNK